MHDLRRQMIIDEVRKNKYTKVSYLASLFDVSEVTIRKDLSALESDGLIVRYHGKIALSEEPAVSYTDRSTHSSEKKALIARVAVSLLRGANSVAIDSGTTTAFIAKELSLYSHLNIVTNSFIAVDALGCSSNCVTFVGGHVIGQSKCTVGPDTEDIFHSLKTDIAFIGCSGIRGDSGLCVGSRLECGVKQSMIASSKRVVAVFDDSKFSEDSFYQFADFSEFDTIITTTPSGNPMALERIKGLGINVIFADKV